MNSLRWRIATWYGLLLVSVIAVVGVIVVAKFQQILYQQAQGRVEGTMNDIARSVSLNPFADPSEIGSLAQRLGNPDNLEHWASQTTFVQVDNLQGYPVGKSFNMGAIQFPAAKGLDLKHDRQFRTVDAGGQPFLIEDRLIELTPQNAVVVHVGEPLNAVQLTIARAQQTVLFVVLLAIAVVVGFSIVLARQATNPLNELAQAMREIGSDHLDRRLKWARRHDEIGRVAETFDDMLARLEDAFARERQFISDASHELKTPLTSINANAQMLRRWGDADETIRHESLDTIIHESAMLAGMVNGMLMLAKADSGDSVPKEPVSLRVVAAEAAHGAEGRATEKGLWLRLHADSDAIVLGDANLLRQMIGNLIDNAIKFTDTGGIDVSLFVEATEAIVEIRDTGPGIDPDEIPYVFDRFYRTDKSRNRAVPGTGLGLAIVRSIARVHEGRVSAERPPGGGASFRVTLPRLADEV